MIERRACRSIASTRIDRFLRMLSIAAILLVSATMAAADPPETVNIYGSLTGPDGKSRNLAVQRPELHSAFLISGFTEPGIYQLKAGDVQRQLAVNVPPAEGMLALYSAADLRQAAGKSPLCISDTPAELERQLSAQRQGRPLWPGLLLLAFLLSMLEVLFANVRCRRKKVPAQLQALLN